MADIFSDASIWWYLRNPITHENPSYLILFYSGLRYQLISAVNCENRLQLCDTAPRSMSSNVLSSSLFLQQRRATEWWTTHHYTVILSTGGKSYEPDRAVVLWVHENFFFWMSPETINPGCKTWFMWCEMWHFYPEWKCQRCSCFFFVFLFSLLPAVALKVETQGRSRKHDNVRENTTAFQITARVEPTLPVSDWADSHSCS